VDAHALVSQLHSNISSVNKPTTKVGWTENTAPVMLATCVAEHWVYASQYIDYQCHKDVLMNNDKQMIMWERKWIFVSRFCPRIKLVRLENVTNIINTAAL
jgi:hypothetical protein